MDKNKRIENTSLSIETKTLEDAIDLIMQEKNIGRNNATKYIFEEIEKKNYVLVDAKSPKTFVSFFFSLHNANMYLYLLYLLLSLLSVNYLPIKYPYFYIRYSFMLTLTLFIPGYIIVDTFIPEKYINEPLLKISFGIFINFLLTSITGYIIILTKNILQELNILYSLTYITIIIIIINSFKKYKQNGNVK